MRPPAPTKVECKHGRLLINSQPEPYVCVCCGQQHRSAGHLCLACR